VNEEGKRVVMSMLLMGAIIVILIVVAGSEKAESIAELNNN
jgi:hypothetical protein